MRVHRACRQDHVFGPSARTATPWRSIGPALLARLDSSTGQSWRAAEEVPGDGRQLLVVCVVRHGRLRWSGANCAAGEVLLIDRADQLALSAENDVYGQILLVPHQRLLPVLGALPPSGVYPATASFVAVSDLCERLSHHAGQAGDGDDLLAAALCHLVAAALAGIDRSDTQRTRRDGELLDRCLATIDAHPGEPLSSATLGRLLGCSRSALYRAAAPLGGVAEMVMRRRLSNVRRALIDPAERRSIAAIAQDQGFARPSQFSRQFKRMFGTTAGAVRASAAEGEGADGRPAVQHR